MSVVAVGIWRWICEEGFWFSFVWGGPENEHGSSFVRLFVLSLLANQPLSLYSPSLCPFFGNHPGLPYPDKVISKRGRPHPRSAFHPHAVRGTVRLSPESVPKASLVHGHFDPADPILLIIMA